MIPRQGRRQSENLKRQNQRSVTTTVSPGRNSVVTGTISRTATPSIGRLTSTVGRNARGVNPPAIATAATLSQSYSGSVRLLNVMPMTPVMLAEYVPADFDAQQRQSSEEALEIVARESGRKDPGHVVIDEVAGQLIALIAMPLGTGIGYAIFGLFLFRLFDITKPWPIRRLEKLPEGTGIMLDDVAAGLLALICAQLWIHFHH